MNFFDFAAWRISRRINGDNKVLKKASDPKEACYGQLPRESRHCVEEVSKEKYSHLVEIDRHMSSPHYSVEFVPDSIFNSFNP